MTSPGTATNAGRTALGEQPGPASSARIVGWTGAGMLDWPGRVATTVFIGGCNLRCGFCHNPDLIDRPAADTTRLSELLRHWHERRSWIDGIVITGGEPTCDPALLALLDEFAALSLPVKLDTNGTNPSVLQSLLDSGVVASVALDLKTVPERYADVTGMPGAWERVARSVSLLLHSCIPHEFRTTVFPGAVSIPELPTIASLVAGGDSYVLQQFRPEHALDEQARETRPFPGDDLLSAAAECARWIPTTVRGA